MKIQALFMVIIGPGGGGHLIHVDSGTCSLMHFFLIMANRKQSKIFKFSHSHTWLNQKYIAKSQLETP